MSLTVCPVGHVICPYNKSHVIRTERIQFHLTKCLPNAGVKPFVVCPFNSTHLIPAAEINNHKLNLCPDRNRLETFLYDVAGTKPLFPVNTFEIECSENWDDAVEHTYDPEKLLNDKKLLVLKQVAPPAERKKFHAEQRRKFQTLPDDEPISVAKHIKKPRQPHGKPITLADSVKSDETVKKEIEEIPVQVEPKKLAPIVEKMENLTVTEKKKSNEFELVVGKKKNKKANVKTSAANQKEAVKTKDAQVKTKDAQAKTKDAQAKTKDAQPKKSEPKVKKHVLNEINTNDFFSDEPKEEEEFIVVTKKKNKTRKH